MIVIIVIIIIIKHKDIKNESNFKTILNLYKLFSSRFSSTVSIIIKISIIQTNYKQY